MSLDFLANSTALVFRPIAISPSARPPYSAPRIVSPTDCIAVALAQPTMFSAVVPGCVINMRIRFCCIVSAPLPIARLAASTVDFVGASRMSSITSLYLSLAGPALASFKSRLRLESVLPVRPQLLAKLESTSKPSSRFLP